MARKMFVLYDGRAKFTGTDDATVMDTASSESEARRVSRTDWKEHDAIWFEYDVFPQKDHDEIRNEKMRSDIGKGFLLA